MALKICPRCKMESDDETGYCEHCGSTLASYNEILRNNEKMKPKKQSGGTNWFVVFFIMCVFAGILAPTLKENREKAKTGESTLQTVFSTGTETTEGNYYGADITFAGLAWGTNFTQAAQTYPDWNLWSMHGENYKEFSVDEVLLGDYKGLDFEQSDINVIGNTFSGEQEVAGYTTSDITLYFAYLPVDGCLTYSESDTALYGARYVFEPQDRVYMYNDLTEKLKSLYGEPNKTSTDTDIYGNEYSYTYWYGTNNTELVLKCLDSTNDTTNIYSDEIVVAYAVRDGDTWLQAASEAVSREKADKEHAAGNDSNGL